MAVLLPRYLGAANLGKYAFVTTLVGVLAIFADLGTTTFLTKEAARDPERAPGLLTAAFIIRFLRTLLVAILIALAFHFLSHDETVRRTAYVLCFSLAVGAVEGVAYPTLQGFHRMKVIALSSSVAALAFAGLAAVVLLRGGGPPEVAMAGLAAAAIAQVINVVALLRVVRPQLRVPRAAFVTVIVGGLPFFLWNAALAVYGQIDLLMLSFLTRPEVVGWYSAAWRLVSIPGFIPVILLTVVFPALSAARREPELFNRIARRAIHVVLVASVPFALGTMLVPNRLTELFGYPETFSHSWWPIVLLAPVYPLVGIDMVIGTVLNTLDRQLKWAATGVAAAILNPLANLWAIPFGQEHLGNGAIAAAAMTTLTEVFMMVVGLCLLPRGVFDVTTVKDALKVAAAAAPLVVVVWASRSQPLAVPVLLGGGVYVATCLVSGVVTLRDLDEVRQHLVRRVSSAAGNG